MLYHGVQSFRVVPDDESKAVHVGNGQPFALLARELGKRTQPRLQVLKVNVDVITKVRYGILGRTVER